MPRCASLAGRQGFATAASRRAILTGFRGRHLGHACAATPSWSPDSVGQYPKIYERQPQQPPSAIAAAAGDPAPAGPRQRTAAAHHAGSSSLPTRSPRKAPPQHSPSTPSTPPSPPPPPPPAAVRSTPVSRSYPPSLDASSAPPPPPPPPSAASPPDVAPSPTPSSPAAAAAVGLSPDELQRYDLSPQQHRQLEIYLDYLLEVNQSMNLTAVRDRGDAWQRHVVDSLALLPVIDRHTAAAAAATTTSSSDSSGDSSGRSRGSGSSSSGRSGSSKGVGGGSVVDEGEGSEEPRARSGEEATSGSSSGRATLRLVDVGTGAGLPGMVLAVARPHWKVTLLDSLRKRCDFLREAAARAGLSNVEVVWCRAEDGGHRPELRQAYDIAVARAVAETRVLAELCLPFVRVGGLWVAAKGPDPEAEVAAAGSAIRQLGGRQVALERVESHSAEGQRTALVVAKTGPTPTKFPRQAGTPNKKPL